MLKIADGREHLYQWDTDVRLILTEPEGVTITEVHFANDLSASAAVVEVQRDGGSATVAVPNILMQSPREIVAYCYIHTANGGHTEEHAIFPVESRKRPDDYVYTETEVRTWVELDARIKALENAPSSSGPAWFQGTKVPGTMAIAGVPGAKIGDYYKNIDNENIYIACVDGSWRKIHDSQQ